MSEGVGVLIVGPGAMGCLHAAMLAEVGVKTGLLDHRAERAERINERGIVLERDGEERTVQVRCSADAADFAPTRLAIILVKAYDTEQATRDALPAIGEDGGVLTLQNGLGNYERISEIVPQARVIAGTTTSGATLLGEGHVREAGRGFVQLGSPTGNHRRAREAANYLRSAGIECEPASSVDEVLWAKAMVNAAINPLTALTGLRNGKLVEIDALRELMNAVTVEVADIARACGIFVREGIVRTVEGICAETAENRSSMLQDLSAGRRTEIDYINGAIAERASERGLDAPLCNLLTTLVKGREEAARDE
ncbi:MAG: 2-dehydropantoate 2-reductase [Armatimonadia bacterium]|nr:2-dehydropantoate 2-reductase [Armatimonadia bacterium]